MSKKFIGGIEGGATHSFAIIMDSSGNIVGRSDGPGTNHYLEGTKESLRRIAQLVESAKCMAGISKTTKLDALGLSLSGCEQEENNQKLLQELQDDYPELAEQVVLASDTHGSVAATSNKGGVVCIAGTGSNTLLINPDGSKKQCGGWGYILGDEGSAWHISLMAVKYCFDELDKLNKSPHPIDSVWALVKSHFNIRSQADILEYFYNKFDKAFIASLTKKLTELVTIKKDPLAIHIFHTAGVYIGKAIEAVVSEASTELTNREGGIHITCVGSVWLSWNLLKTGFLELISTKDIEELTLIKLNVDHGVGAAYLASDKFNIPMDKDYSKNYTVLYHYKKKK